MGYTGDHTAIGPLTYWDSHYIMSGNKYVSRAVIASALCYGSMAINYRSTATDMVVSHTECYGKLVEGLGWPRTGSNFGRYVEYGSVEVNHEPAVGLVAFLCCPSPCLIEMQKQAHMNAVCQSSGTQIFGYYFDIRGKAWCYRNLAHAIWLTPTVVSGTKASSVTAWRSAAVANMGANTGHRSRPPQVPRGRPALQLPGCVGVGGDEHRGRRRPGASARHPPRRVDEERLRDP